MKTTARNSWRVAMATMLLSTAYAQQKAHDEMSGPDTKGSIEAEIKRADANGDGKVSAAEHEADSKRAFESMDANRDKRITVAELGAAPLPADDEASHGHQKGDSHRIEPVERIKAVDANGDGVMSAEESAAGSKALFRKMDLDRDGFLSATEVKAKHPTQLTVGDN